MRLVMGGESLEGPLTGIGQYTYHLAQEMLARPEIEDFKFLAHGRLLEPSSLMIGSGRDSEQGTENARKSSRLNKALGKVRSIAAQNKIAVALYEQLMPVLEGRSLRKYGVNDVFHSPNYMLPVFPGRRVISILDLSTYRYPDEHPRARVEFVNRHIEKAIKHADHIITISNLVKSEIIEQFNYPGNRISVTYLAADNGFHPISEEDFLEQSTSLGLAYKGYFLFVSSIEPRKNLDRLLDAYLAYRNNGTGNALPLIVAGIPGWKSDGLHARLRKLEAQGIVRYLGYVEQSQLPALISGARALLYPSLYEGFGLPVLEAMQCGTAVMTSRETAMAEIGGDAVMQVDPKDIHAMTDCIENLANDADVLSDLSRNSIERATQFSWQHCAEDTLAAYQLTAHQI